MARGQARDKIMDESKVPSRNSLRVAAVVVALVTLAGCEEGQTPGFLQPKDKPAETGTAPGQSTKLVERDVEAPEVFQVTEAGLWDGRPSLGGVWVAHADVTDPQRVIIRNSANNKFVIGALFRREREIPGPRIQASSDAAAALGMLAGAPVELNVTALVREAVKEPEPIPTVIEEKPIPTVIADTSDDIAETSLDPIAGAAAAIDASEPVAEPVIVEKKPLFGFLKRKNPKPEAEATELTAAPLAEASPAAIPTEIPAAAAPAPAKPKASSPGKPYIQIGIFSVKANANQTADQMRRAGMVPTVYEQSGNGKPFWRVVVGPAQNSSERNTLLKKVKSTGFSDAYFVTN